MTWGTYSRLSEEFESDPPARLTKAGFAMLVEIWTAAGRPAKPADENYVGDFTVDIRKLNSHHGPAAKRRSAAAIRTRLVRGGYLDLELEDDDESDAAPIILEIGLSPKAFVALAEAGHQAASDL